MKRAAMILVAALAQSAGAQNGADLAFSQIGIESVTPVDDYFEIEFSYEIRNIGSGPIDLAGHDSENPLDDVIVQTWLTDSRDGDGPIFPSGGSVLIDPVVLAPGESFHGVYVSNSSQLPDPGVFGANAWLVVTIKNTTEDWAELGNNTAILRVPGTECPADFNADGSVDFFDLLAFLNAYSGQDASGDLNEDGAFDFFDLQAFLTSLAAGCP